MNRRPTPETDAADGKPTWQENIIEKGWVPADFGRRLELERDELRADLEFRRGLFKLQEEQLNEVRAERDAERALADRLARLLELYFWKYEVTGYNSEMSKALNAWKEARND